MKAPIAMSLILSLAMADRETMEELSEFFDSMTVKNPMDDPEFVKRLDERMSGSAKTSESGSEFFPEVLEDIKKNQEKTSAK